MARTKAPNGQAFHDLGSRKFRKTNLPSRALRMVQPNEKHRLDLEMIAKRCLEGDISIINLSDMTHMQSQQNFLRRELRNLSEYTGLHVYSLDKEEKMMLVPGKDVVVDSTRHQLGMNGFVVNFDYFLEISFNVKINSSLNGNRFKG